MILEKFYPQILALALIVMGVFDVSVSAWAQTMQISSPNAILLDAGTNTVLFEKGADELVPPASTVKILTAEMIFRDLAAGKIKLDDE